MLKIASVRVGNGFTSQGRDFERNCLAGSAFLKELPSVYSLAVIARHEELENTWGKRGVKEIFPFEGKLCSVGGF